MENIETIATGATVNTTSMHHHNSSNNSNSSNSIDIQIVSPPPLAAAAAPILIDQQDDDGKKEKKNSVICCATNQHHNDPLRTEQEQQEEDGEEAGIEITVDGCEEVSIPTKRSSDNSITDSVAIVSKNNSPNRFPKSQGSHNHKQDRSSSTIRMTKDQPPQKSLHDSSFAATEKTAELSHLDSSRDSLNLSFESNHSQSSNHNICNNIHSNNNNSNNNKGGVSLILPNELLADALEQLTDIAVATGIVSNPSSSTTTDILLGRGTNPSEKRVEKDTSLRHGKTRTTSHILQEGEEPGRIYSAANSSSGDCEEQENEGEWGEGRPFDEEPVLTKSVGGPFKSEEELSAIVRMRYYRAMGKNLPGGGEDTSDDNNKKKKTRKNGMDAKSSQEIQRETMERWKNLKQEVSRQEVERMKLFGQENPSPSRVVKSKRKKTSKIYDSSTTTASGSYSEEGDGSVDGVGLFDFSFLTRSLEEAWNQSQATLLEAMVGDGKESGESEEESYASWEEEEEDYEETSDSSKEYRGRKQRGRRRRSGGNNWNAKEYDEDVEEDIDDDDDQGVDLEEEEEEEDHDNQDGRIGSASNRNFLEVSVTN